MKLDLNFWGLLEKIKNIYLEKIKGQATVKLTGFVILLLVGYVFINNYVNGLQSTEASDTLVKVEQAQNVSPNIPQPAALTERNEKVDRGTDIKDRVPIYVNDNKVKIPVLMYHEVVDEGTDIKSIGLVVTKEEFEKQIVSLKEQGYNAITLVNLYDALKKGEALPPKPFVITFDDGYASFYTKVYPILKKHQVKASVGLITGFMTQTPSNSYLSWDQVKEMNTSGLVEFVNHTLTHQGLGDISQDYKWTKREIADAQRDISTYCGYRTDILVYPCGSYNDRVIEIEKEDNLCKMAFTTKPGLASKESNIWAIPRVRVLHDDTGGTIIEKIIEYQNKY